MSASAIAAAATTRALPGALPLYRQMWRAASNFRDYNFREYARRNVREKVSQQTAMAQCDDRMHSERSRKDKIVQRSDGADCSSRSASVLSSSVAIVMSMIRLN